MSSGGPLSRICAEPERFECVMILPEPQPTAPWGTFKAVSARLDPARRTGSLVYSRRREDGWTYGGKAQLTRGDCLLHIPTGAVVSVVRSVGHNRVVIEGWEEPVDAEKQALWAKAPGLGRWVVWGWCARSVDEIPPHARPSEVIQPEQFREAKRDLWKHPERLPWGEAGLAVGADPSKMRPKQRKRLRRQLRSLLGGLHTVQTEEDLDALIEKTAVKRKSMKNGGELIRWRLGGQPRK